MRENYGDEIEGRAAKIILKYIENMFDGDILSSEKLIELAESKAIPEEMVSMIMSAVF